MLQQLYLKKAIYLTRTLAFEFNSSPNIQVNLEVKRMNKSCHFYYYHISFSTLFCMLNRLYCDLNYIDSYRAEISNIIFGKGSFYPFDGF